MKVPPNMTEEEVIDVIVRVSKKVAWRYKFGYYEEDDIQQEAFIIGMTGMEYYDENYPLENFLITHINNRLKNFKRNNYYRREPICATCNNKSNECTICKRREHHKTVRQNLMRPIEFGQLDVSAYHNLCDKYDYEQDVHIAEFHDIIKRRLPVNMREDYLKMLDGVYVEKMRRQEIQQLILEIIGEEDELQERAIF